MALAYSKVTTQGQISIPATIRQRLGLSPGTMLEWQDQRGQIVVKKAARYSSEDVHRAVFASKKLPAKTSEELKDGVRQSIKLRHARR